ncbi:MAG: HAD-IA family hydrolase [Muribaculaceae bacterium]|nr:HAD-IA family hydrolase [Muribaculaceae bacterium]
MIYAPNIIRYLQRRGCSRVSVKAALIDMDGTLYDSMPWHVAAWRHMSQKLGWKLKDEDIYLLEGMKGVAMVPLLEKRYTNRDLSEEEAREIYARKAEYFTSIAKIDVMPGAQQMLKTLKDFNIRRILVTGSAQRTLLDGLDRDFPGIFAENDRVTAFGTKKGKPDPEPYLNALAHAGIRADEAIVIENAPLGVESGHRSGTFTIAVATGPIPVQTLEEAGADIVFPSMPEFAQALPTLLFDLKTVRLD